MPHRSEVIELRSEHVESGPRAHPPMHQHRQDDWKDSEKMDRIQKDCFGGWMEFR